MSRRLRLSSALVAATIAVAGGASIAGIAPGPAAVAATAGTPDGAYTSLSPARILDTRYAKGVPTRTPVGEKKTITIQVAGKGGVPSSGALAVVMNLTVTRPTSRSGYLTVWPAGKARPVVSSINWTTKGWTGANLVTVPLGAGGKVSIYNSAGSTDVIADVMGYYHDATATTAQYGSYLVTDEPTRIVDTRDPEIPLSRPTAALQLGPHLRRLPGPGRQRPVSRPSPST